MGPPHSSSIELLKHDAGVKDRSCQIGIQDPLRAVQLEQVPPCTFGLQSGRLWRWQHQGIVGFLRCGQLVPGSIHRSLLMWYLLYTRDTCLPYFGLDRAVPPTLSTPRFYSAPTPTCTHQWVNRPCTTCKCNAKKDKVIVITANLYYPPPIVEQRVDDNAIVHEEE